MSEGDLILYTTEDGAAQFVLREMHGSVWLTQLELAELFQTSKQNIGQHISKILAEGELQEGAVVKQNFTTAADGKQYKTLLYSLPMILAVGYRVRSPRGTQFRQWATATLGEYLHKGFVMDDERLKDPAWDYFDELLERIRDIRASEKRFYQKIRELFALAEDYQAREQDTAHFFAEVQNKMLFAVTGHTAAELVKARADAAMPNMGLQSWKGARVRKADVTVAKNYLNQDEVSELNRITTMFLDYAEDRAAKKQGLTLADWQRYVDNFLLFNERPLLDHRGRISHARMEQIAHERYAEFDGKRREREAREADAVDLEALEQTVKKASRSRGINTAGRAGGKR